MFASIWFVFPCLKRTEIDCDGRKSNDAYNENIFYGQNTFKNNTEFNGNHINGNIFKMWLIWPQVTDSPLALLHAYLTFTALS